MLYLYSSYLYSFDINASVYYESYNLFAFNKTILNNVAIPVFIMMANIFPGIVWFLKIVYLLPLY